MGPGKQLICLSLGNDGEDTYFNIHKNETDSKVVQATSRCS